MAVRAVLVAGFVLLLVALGVTIASSAPRDAGSNFVPQDAEVAQLRGHAERCQDAEFVPEDAGALRLLVGTYGRPAPEIRVTARTADGTLVTAGRRPPGGPEGKVDIPVRETSAAHAGTSVCVSVAGPGRTVLYGSGEALRLEWLRPGSESWLDLIPTVAHRFGLAKWSPLGAWLIALAALLVVAAWCAAARLLLRELRA